MNNTIRNIRWAAIQPRLGGMYLAAENIIGHPAEFILSYPGYDSVSVNGDVITDSGHEYGLIKYLTKHNRMPDYYNFKREVIQADLEMDPTIVRIDDVMESHTEIIGKPDYLNLDLVVSVPVCAGLSTYTPGHTKDPESRNNNLKYLAEYVLNVIRPRAYVFENAPGLMGKKGDSIRVWLKSEADRCGYSVIFYKTDAMYHNNCQHRPRTFVIMLKDVDGKHVIPDLGFEHREIDLETYMNEIPSDATQQTPVDDIDVFSEALIMWLKNRYGDNWRDRFDGKLSDEIMETKETRSEFVSWVEANCRDKVSEAINKHFRHIEEKLDMGKGWWSRMPVCYKTFFPSVMDKSIHHSIHYKEDRMYSIRELLHLMGMPDDYEFQGKYYSKIGQNVPVQMAQFVINQVVNFLESDEKTFSEDNTAVFDNIEMKKTNNI